MKNKVIGICPICGKNLKVTELSCETCGTSIHGDFNLSRFDYLTPSQQEFAFIFLKNAGNIKLIEKDLNISYPTVKKNLDEVISALGFEQINELPAEKMTKKEILKALKAGDISFEVAEELLKECEEDD